MLSVLTVMAVFAYYVPGGSAFSGEYVVFCHQELISVFFLCSVTLWIEVDPQVLIRPSDLLPHVKIQTWSKLDKYSTGNFIHVQLQPPCLLPASVWCPTPPWTLWPLWSVIKLLLAANEVLKNLLKICTLPRWLSALRTWTKWGRSVIFDLPLAFI